MTFVLMQYRSDLQSKVSVMDRRNFLKVTAATGAVIAVSPSVFNQKLYADNGALYSAYERVKLVDANGKAIKASKLKKETNYIFNYPHRGTPAMMIDLGKTTYKDINLKSEDGTSYIWKSGVGVKRTIVAYTAICSHQLAHPTPNDSFIQYVPTGTKSMVAPKGGMIVCSSHLSAFDASKGAKRTAGPAVEPLAAIVLEVDQQDQIWAVGVLGPDKFHEYFKTFKPELKEFYKGKRKAKKLVSISAKTVTLKEYSKDIIQY